MTWRTPLRQRDSHFSHTQGGNAEPVRQIMLGCWSGWRWTRRGDRGKNLLRGHCSTSLDGRCGRWAYNMPKPTHEPKQVLRRTHANYKPRTTSAQHSTRHRQHESTWWHTARTQAVTAANPLRTHTWTHVQANALHEPMHLHFNPLHASRPCYTLTVVIR